MDWRNLVLTANTTGLGTEGYCGGDDDDVEVIPWSFLRPSKIRAFYSVFTYWSNAFALAAVYIYCVSCG